MTIGELGNIGEFVSAIGVIVTLVYLAIQIRQSNKLAITSAYQARADANINLVATALQSPGGAVALNKCLADQPLDDAERAFVDWYAEATLVYYENNHFQYCAGQISEEHWQATVGSIRRFLALRTSREYWQRNAGTYRDSFRAVVDQIVGEVSNEE